MGIQYKNINELEIKDKGIRGSRISSEDLDIFGSLSEPIDFGENPNDKLEFSVYEPENDELLFWDVLDEDRLFTISGPESDNEKKIVLKPAEDLRNAGFEEGQYTINYSFFRDQFGLYKNPRARVYIQEISQTRKEIRLMPLLGDDPDQNEYIKNRFFDFAQGKISGDDGHDLIKKALDSYTINDLRDYLARQGKKASKQLIAATLQTLDENDLLIRSRILTRIRSLIKESNYVHLTKMQILKLFYSAAADQVDDIVSKYGATVSSNRLKNNDKDGLPPVQSTSAGPMVAGNGNKNANTLDYENFDVDPNKFKNESFKADLTKYLVGSYYDHLEQILDRHFTQRVPEDWRVLQNLLNFGKNETYLIANWEIDTTTFSDTPSIVAKMYEPLPQTIGEKDKCWITQEVSPPVVDNVFLLAPETSSSNVQLRGPNWSADATFDNKSSGRTDYETFDDLLSTNPASSQDILDSYVSLSSPGVELNIDYTNYENFINFSRAAERLKNFKYKLRQIESYNAKINNFESSNYSGSDVTQNEIEQLKTKKRVLINGFDGYEDYLYYESGSYYSGSAGTNNIGEWPKRNNTPPYELYSVTSSEGVSWFNDQLEIAEIYDRNNRDSLVNVIPFHITENDENKDWLVFHDMIGQHFDTVFSYIKELEEISSRDQSITEGLSEDLTHVVAESFGWNLYHGNNTSELIENAVGPTGSAATGSMKSLSPETRSKEVWRRILNNMPYLLKSKGTERSVKALLACYGIPSTFFSVREYGGPNPNSGDSQQIQDDFTYGLDFVRSNNTGLISEWKEARNTAHPSTIEFKFNTENENSQTLFKGDSNEFIVWLEHISGSEGKLVFSLDGDEGYKEIKTNQKSFFDGRLHSVMLKRSSGSDGANIDQTYKLYSKLFDYGKIVSATSSSLTITGSSSVTASSYNNNWTNPPTVEFGTSSPKAGAFDGYADEYRFWLSPLSESKFDNHVTYAEAYDGNKENDYYNNLLMRLSFNRPTNLGSGSNKLKNVAANVTYTPAVTSSGFPDKSEYPHNFVSYTRQNVADVPNIGGNMPVSNKIRLEDSSLVFGNLSPTQRAELSSYDFAPLDSNKLGIFISPIDTINQDILASFGDFQFDDKIGDPSDQFNYSYKALKDINEFYWKKYESSEPDTNEYIRYLRLFDKSLFEHLLDLLPERANKDTGMLVEPHYLERPKVKWKEMSREDLTKDDNVDAFIKEAFAEKIQKEAIVDRERNVELIAEKVLKEGVVDRKNLREAIAEKIVKEGIVNAERDIVITAEKLLRETTIDLFLYDSSDYFRPTFPSTDDQGKAISQDTKDHIIEKHENGILTIPAQPKNDWHDKGSYIYAPEGYYTFYEDRRNRLRFSENLDHTRSKNPWTLVQNPVTSSYSDTEPYSTASKDVTKLGDTNNFGIIRADVGKRESIVQMPRNNPVFSVYVKAASANTSSRLDIRFNDDDETIYEYQDDQFSDSYWTRVKASAGTGSADYVKLEGRNVLVQRGQLEEGGSPNTITGFQPTQGGSREDVYRKVLVRDEDGTPWSTAYQDNHFKNTSTYRESVGQRNLRYFGCKQTTDTTIDGKPPFERVIGDDSELQVVDTNRDSDAPILDVE